MMVGWQVENLFSDCEWGTSYKVDPGLEESIISTIVYFRDIVILHNNELGMHETRLKSKFAPSRMYRNH